MERELKKELRDKRIRKLAAIFIDVTTKKNSNLEEVALRYIKSKNNNDLDIRQGVLPRVEDGIDNWFSSQFTKTLALKIGKILETSNYAPRLNAEEKHNFTRISRLLMDEQTMSNVFQHDVQWLEYESSQPEDALATRQAAEKLQKFYAHEPFVGILAKDMEEEEKELPLVEEELAMPMDDLVIKLTDADKKLSLSVQVPDNFAGLWEEMVATWWLIIKHSACDKEKDEELIEGFYTNLFKLCLVHDNLYDRLGHLIWSYFIQMADVTTAGIFLDNDLYPVLGKDQKKHLYKRYFKEIVDIIVGVMTVDDTLIYDALPMITSHQRSQHAATKKAMQKAFKKLTLHCIDSIPDRCVFQPKKKLQGPFEDLRDHYGDGMLVYEDGNETPEREIEEALHQDLSKFAHQVGVLFDNKHETMITRNHTTYNVFVSQQLRSVGKNPQEKVLIEKKQHLKNQLEEFYHRQHLQRLNQLEVDVDSLSHLRPQDYDKLRQALNNHYMYGVSKDNALSSVRSLELVAWISNVIWPLVFDNDQDGHYREKQEYIECPDPEGIILLAAACQLRLKQEGIISDYENYLVPIRSDPGAVVRTEGRLKLPVWNKLWATKHHKHHGGYVGEHDKIGKLKESHYHKKPTVTGQSVFEVMVEKKDERETVIAAAICSLIYEDDDLRDILVREGKDPVSHRAHHLLIVYALIIATEKTVHGGFENKFTKNMFANVVIPQYTYYRRMAYDSRPLLEN